MKSVALAILLLASHSIGHLQAAAHPHVEWETPVPGRLPYFLRADLSPVWRQVPTSAILLVPAFALSNQNGAAFTQKNMLGCVTVAHFFYTSCSGLCPQVIRHLLPLQATYAQNAKVNIVSMTIVPNTDNTQVLQAFARANGIRAANWHLLTGKQSAIFRLARQGYQADTRLLDQSPQSDLLHSEHVFLVDQQLRVRGIYNGNSTAAIEQLMADVGQLL